MFEIDRDLCTGCGVCVEECATSAISMHDRVATIDQALCTSCGACADTCLSGAVVATNTGSSLFPRGAPAHPPRLCLERRGHRFFRRCGRPGWTPWKRSCPAFSASRVSPSM